MSLSWKLLIVMATLLLIQLGLGATLYALHRNTQIETDRIKHSLIVSTGLAKTVSQIALLKTLFKAADVNLISLRTAELSASLQALVPEFKGQPDKMMVLVDAREHMQSCQQIALRAQKLLMAKKFDEQAEPLVYLPLRQHMLKMVDDTTALTKILQEEETITQRALNNERSWRELGVTTTRVGVSLEILIIACSFFWFQRDITRRMRIIVENADRITQHRPLLPELEGQDEISRLDKSFHNIAHVLSRADQEERDLIEKQRDVICQLTRTLAFINLNQACQIVFGHAASHLAGKSLRDYVHPDDLNQLDDKFASCLDSTQPPFEARVVRLDLTLAELLWSVHWSQYSQSYFCVVRDITAQKQAERLRQEVLQMVGHDLKSPLTTVGGFLQLLQTPSLANLTEKGQDLAGDGVAAAQQMSDLIKDLLNLETIRAGMFTLQREPVALSQLIASIVANAGEMARSAHVTLAVNESDLRVVADQERIEQVVHNFIVNSIRRSQSGATVMVETQRSGACVRVLVKDSGTIIRPEDLSHIFDPFLSDPIHGSVANLSMAICKAFAELHGGHVFAQSAEQGATFVLELPG